MTTLREVLLRYAIDEPDSMHVAEVRPQTDYRKYKAKQG